jgi:hypothetical protein
MASWLGKIPIVDDDAVVRQIAYDVLLPRGLASASAADGAKAASHCLYERTSDKRHNEDLLRVLRAPSTRDSTSGHHLQGLRILRNRQSSVDSRGSGQGVAWRRWKGGEGERHSCRQEVGHGKPSPLELELASSRHYLVLVVAHVVQELGL